MITVYTTGSACVQCRMTKQVLTSAGLEFADVDLTDPENALARELRDGRPRLHRSARRRGR